MTIGITEFAAGFEYEETERGISCTRVYRYDPENSYADDELPSVGDKFTYPDIGTQPMAIEDLDETTVRSITMHPLAGSPQKYEYIVTYNNEPIDGSVFSSGGSFTPTDVEDLPKNIEFSGEFSYVNPEKGDGWTWQTGGDAVTQAVPKRVNTSTLRITRYVKDSNYDIFQKNVQNLTAHVNHADNPFGTTIGGLYGSWLFVGAHTEFFRNANNEDWWRAELEFIYRDPDGTGLSGWSTLMKLDGSFDMPKNPNPVGGEDTLYITGDFSALFDDSVFATP